MNDPSDSVGSGASPGEQRWLGTQRIGRYEIVRRIALGGMAELFLGRVSGISGFEKLVAVKRILPHLAGDSDFVAMFRREARIAASLEHPNIVHVSDLGHDGKDYYLVMPFLVGKDLLTISRELERRGEQFPLAHTVTIAVAIAAGLDYAHRKSDPRGQPLGIVHRDVSPSNIFVTYGGEIKLLDFGIARASSEVRITRPGIRKGKTRYMSPEQCKDAPLDGRSDVFSLGTILYELTTRRRLFDADNDAAAIDQIVRQPIAPPSHWLPTYPRALERIVMRALAQDRDQRYASARQLRDDLEQFADEQRLRVSSHAVGEYVAQVFGAPVEATVDHGSIPPLPASPVFGPPALPFVPVAVAHATVHPAGPPVPAFLDPPRPYPGAIEAATSESGRARRGRGETLAIVIIVVASLVAFGTAVSWWLRKAEDAGSATARASVQPATAPGSADGDGPTPRQWLAAVNHPDPRRALEYRERHFVLAELRKHPDVWAEVDTRLQIVLDLLQAGDSPDPCTTMRNALDAIAKLDDPYFSGVLDDPQVRTKHPSCPDVDERSAALRAQGSARGALSKRPQ